MFGKICSSSWPYAEISLGLHEISIHIQTITSTYHYLTVQHGGDGLRVGADGIPPDAGHCGQTQSIFGTLRDVHGVYEQTENLVYHSFTFFRTEFCYLRLSMAVNLTKSPNMNIILT